MAGMLAMTPLRADIVSVSGPNSSAGQAPAIRLTSPPDVTDQCATNLGQEGFNEKQQVTTNWTDWLAISKQSRHADASWNFIQFVADKDNLLKYNETMYFIPPRKSLRTAGYMSDPQLQQFVTIMEKYGRSINTNPAALEVYQTIMQNAVDDAVYQKKSSKQALDDAARNIARAMRR